MSNLDYPRLKLPSSDLDIAAARPAQHFFLTQNWLLDQN